MNGIIHRLIKLNKEYMNQNPMSLFNISLFCLTLKKKKLKLFIWQEVVFGVQKQFFKTLKV